MARALVLEHQREGNGRIVPFQSERAWALLLLVGMLCR